MPNHDNDAAELAHQIAHEIKGPLGGIAGLSMTARRLYDRLSDDERREFFELIDSEAARLSKVADQIATLLVLEADDLSYHVEEVAAGELLEEAVSGWGSGISVTSAGGMILRCDRLRTTRIVTDLLDNAATYGFGAEQVGFTIREEDGLGRIEITDDGPGLAPELHERCFERFTTVRPAGYEDIPGAGLSLYLGRAQARAMGGDLVMEPKASGGTMLAFTLPRVS